MLKSKKHVFWEALIMTILIFLMGFLFGTYMERGQYNKMNDYAAISEINLIDGLTLMQLSQNAEINCEILKQRNIEFADKVYEEARILEKYETSSKITESMKILHRKYDLLRTLAWISNSNTIERCNNYDLIIYLYEYETENLNKKATQAVWSRKLTDIKKQNPNSVLLPIAIDQDLSSLNIILDKYYLQGSPTIIVNDKEVFYNIDDFDL